MKPLGIEGVRRGRRCITTIPSETTDKPLDLVNCQFSENHPNQPDLILDALEQALWARGKPTGVIHYRDRGSQYLSIRYTNRLNEAGFNASVGSVGDSYDNALAETINGLYKAEVIYKSGP